MFRRLRYSSAGESHGPCLTVILEGMPAGLPVSAEKIREDLARRQLPTGAGGRMAIETDTARILAGVMEGKTTGAPIALQIENRDREKWNGKPIPSYTTPRPGHADLAALAKYGFHDIRPALERASARETACRVAAGSICRALLSEFKIRVGGFVRSIGPVSLPDDAMNLETLVSRTADFPTCIPDPDANERALREIERAKQDGETLGGVIEVGVFRPPVGLGSYVTPEERLDARLAAAVISVPAVKGVEIGDAFANTRHRGTEVHDPILDDVNGNLLRGSNHCGGIEGGISNGETIWLRAATLKAQPTVDLAAGRKVGTRYERSDFCPVPRAVVVLESVVAMVIADALLEKLGGDTMTELRIRHSYLHPLRWGDFPSVGMEETHLFWDTQ